MDAVLHSAGLGFPKNSVGASQAQGLKARWFVFFSVCENVCGIELLDGMSFWVFGSPDDAGCASNFLWAGAKAGASDNVRPESEGGDCFGKTGNK